MLDKRYILQFDNLLSGRRPTWERGKEKKRERRPERRSGREAPPPSLPFRLGPRSQLLAAGVLPVALLLALRAITAALDLDVLGLSSSRRSRNRDLQNPVLKAGVDLILVYVLG